MSARVFGAGARGQWPVAMSSATCVVCWCVVPCRVATNNGNGNDNDNDNGLLPDGVIIFQRSWCNIF